MPPAMTILPLTIISRVGSGFTRRGLDDATVTDPDVAGLVPTIGRIDDPSPGEMRQHDQAPVGRAVAISARTCATETA